MHFRKLGILAAIMLSTGLACSLFAQGPGRMYNPATEATIQGKVTAVQNPAGRHGWNGTHLTVQSGEQKYDVHVGPSDYVAGKGFTFAEGDKVQIVGSKVEMNGAQSLIAREITKDGKTLALRDKQGFPLWSGGRRMAQ